MKQELSKYKLTCPSSGTVLLDCASQIGFSSHLRPEGASAGCRQRCILLIIPIALPCSGAAGSGQPRPSLQAMLEYVQQQFTENIGDVQTVAYTTNDLANFKYGGGINRALLRAGLGLWLWLDEKCASLAEEV